MVVSDHFRERRPRTAGEAVAVIPAVACGDDRRVRRRGRKEGALQRVREGAHGKLGDERTLAVWVPAHLTEPEKADPTSYDHGDLLQFHQNAPGVKNGSRLVAAEGQALPLTYADRFEVYRPATLAVAVGDRLRNVNWRVSARRGDLWVDERHPDRNGDVIIFLDTFADSRDGERLGAKRAVLAAWAVASAQLRVRDRVGVVSFGGYPSGIPPSTGGRA